MDIGGVVQKFIVVPAVAVLGLYVVGQLLAALFGVPAWLLFGAAGGVGAVAWYFRRNL